MLIEATGKPTPLATIRVLFFGMTGMLSRIPLAILLNGGGDGVWGGAASLGAAAVCAA
ncbi:MAG: hypothetical protein HC804_01415 [Anaerolineae bacterium]|nr:hypothetical protein [Anaerolineae bacterium]